MGGLAKSPLAGLAALGLGGLAPSNTGGLNPAGIGKSTYPFFYLFYFTPCASTPSVLNRLTVFEGFIGKYNYSKVENKIKTDRVEAFYPNPKQLI